MINARYLFTASLVALASSLLLFALLVYQHHFDLFSWSFPGFEVCTFQHMRFKRNLELYANAAGVLLALSVILGAVALLRGRPKLP
ncbi:MAG: hypothetical protein M3371_09570 [Acidobacteriota bacterium]|nr:hypothetical protein [Acidobacteriota bacterium]